MYLRLQSILTRHILSTTQLQLLILEVLEAISFEVFTEHTRHHSHKTSQKNQELVCLTLYKLRYHASH